MTERSETPKIAEVIRRAIDARLADVHIGMPARVTFYDATKMSVTAQPLVLRGFLDEDESRQAELLPEVTEVPVIFPGSGGVRIKFPIVPGDTVWLQISSVSLDRWLEIGGEIDPQDDRHHALTDAVAIPGLQDFTRAKDADTQIEFTVDGEIHAGGSGSLAKASELEELRDAIEGALNGDAIPGVVGLLGPYSGTTKLKGS